MLEIIQIPALQDNYIYVVHEPVSGATAAVDPAEAGPVLDVLHARNWRLTHVLNTHHHGDHVGGNLALKQATGCIIIGAAGDRGRIPGIDVDVAEGMSVTLGDAKADVLEVPGHTSGHVAYHFADDHALFCGDTLFALGCGRLFEGSPQQMWASLTKIKALPPQTRIYCAHEYTQTNGRFALTVEPDNPALIERIGRVDALRAQGSPTVPSTLAEELDTNPFLRADRSSMRGRLGLHDAPDWQVFAAVRQMKDSFRG